MSWRPFCLGVLLAEITVVYHRAWPTKFILTEVEVLDIRWEIKRNGRVLGRRQGKKAEAEGPVGRLRNRGFLGNVPGSVKCFKQGSNELILKSNVEDQRHTPGPSHWGLGIGGNELLPAAEQCSAFGE